MTTIITTFQLRNLESELSLGAFDISKDGETIQHEGQEYKYHASGLCREVFLSEDGEWVLKIPIVDNDLFAEDWEEYMATPKLARLMPLAIRHNLLEAKAWADADESTRMFLAESHLVNRVWVKQKFVKVHNVNIGEPSYREAGIDFAGNVVCFDFDCLFDYFDAFTEPVHGFRYERCKSLTQQAEADLRTRGII